MRSLALASNRSDCEIEHLTEGWLEMILLDKLVLELDRNGVLDMSARRRADSPTSSMMTPAPAEESRAVCSPTAISLWQLAEALPDDRGTI